MFVLIVQALAEESKVALLAKGGGRSQAVTGILQAAKNGGELSKVGVLGRLGDLASVSEEYDVAVSTACGMLDHIVVQTTAGAQRCLEFLRKHGLGRANFIPLDKMKKGAHDRAVETPEGAPRLFELITPVNFAITPAIFLAVADTLVAPDLETATRWAYDFNKRWRVVTLDGKLIETSGTMAGGGTSVRKGGMRLQVSHTGSKFASVYIPLFTHWSYFDNQNARSKAAAAAAAVVGIDDSVNDCKELEQQAAQALELLQECRKRRKALTEEIRTLNKRVKALTLQIPKLAMEIGGCDTTRDELTKRIPELRAQSQLNAADAKKVRELNQKVGKCKSDMASCAMLASKLEADVARLQKAILEAGGSKLKKQQAACEKALADLDASEKALNTAKVAITTSHKAAAKAKEAKAMAEIGLEECKEILEERQSEFKALEADAVKVMQAYEEVKAVEAEKRLALEQVMKECEALKKSTSEIKCTEIDLLGKVEAFDKQIGECERRMNQFKQEISKLRSAEMEDDCFDDSDDESNIEAENKEDVADQEGSDVEMDEGSVSALAVSEPKGTTAKSGGRSSLATLSFASLEQYDIEEVKNDISTLERERSTLAKNANMGAIAEYRKKEADYLSR